MYWNASLEYEGQSYNKELFQRRKNAVRMEVFSSAACICGSKISKFDRLSQSVFGAIGHVKVLHRYVARTVKRG